MNRTRFSQPDDYEPASIDKDEVVQQHFRDKNLADILEVEDDERGDDSNEWASYE